MSEERSTLASSLEAGARVTANVRLVAPLGAGGMGAVWLADHEGLKTRVVVKFMLGEGTTPSLRTRFSREAEAAAQVKSPHVVQMLDHGVTADGVPFIVMEHLVGQDLGQWIAAKGRLDPDVVLTIVSQIARALMKVHAAGFVHRDVKPGNVFLCEGEDDVFAKLLDFGIAKSDAPLDGASTDTGQIVGTPFYMSPEQVTGDKAIDARTDVWSLGVVAFEALTGRRPFDGASFGALAVAIATGTPPALTSFAPALPPAVDFWFAKACARHPAARFPTPRALAEALREAVLGEVGQHTSRPDSGESTAMRPVAPTFGLASTIQSGPPTASRPRQIRPQWLVLGGLGVLGLAALRLATTHDPPTGATTTATPPPLAARVVPPEPIAIAVPPEPSAIAQPVVSLASLRSAIDAGRPPAHPPPAKPPTSAIPSASAPPKPSARPPEGDPLF